MINTSQTDRTEVHIVMNTMYFQNSQKGLYAHYNSSEK